MPEEDQTPQDPPIQPPAQAAIPVADLSGALVDAYKQIMAGQPQPNRPQDPIDAMSPEERQSLQDQFLTDPLGAARRVAGMGAKAAEDRLLQQAMPLIQTSANTIVELYKARKRHSDTRFTKIEPLFDKLMMGVDITPLVRMSEATRNSELDMRWKMARADVIELELKNQKPEPTLLSNGSNGGPSGPDLENDPWLQNMKSQYKFTDDQIKDILGV